ncbi:DUF3784 domain-containing protein [Cellulomonas oligotrophica]|uniref:Uncharacterized protein n=1 Tax=Cellulomonas oligotrophica TaxID=931536 RepID=A0A7Y9FG34_9CELL|nr:DUF3784 domain-containing protein [Cellulomonas oligotrophica]NYD86609.1 hypothetical protein [Cellulomonas oligotrophica]GIG32503.1 hypothetical protein Col01nite_16620 [Cellulomonas oligotrophica]
MSTEEKPSRDKAKDEGGAFLAIGFVFVILGLSGMGSDNRGSMVAFFAVGVVFLALSRTSAQRHRARTGDDAPTGDSSTPTGGTDADAGPAPAADDASHDGDPAPRPSPEP